MATILPMSGSTFELARLFRVPRCYAPDHVVAVLRTVVEADDVALLIDVDALERSALARIDRVMQLAFAALSHAKVKVFFAARSERERAITLQRAIPDSRFVVRSAPLAIPVARDMLAASVPLIVISNDPAAFELLGERDRGLALGRPELSRINVTSLADTSVRASLWWLYEARARALAS
jgi:hypothetical protein